MGDVFGSGLDIGGGTTAPDDTAPDGQGAGPSSPNTFGSGLFGRKTEIYANRPQMNSENPAQDRIDALQAGRQRLQRSLNNPLRAFLRPEEYQQDVKTAAELDQQILGTQQAIQKQKAMSETALSGGMNRAIANTVPWATADEQTIENAWTKDLAGGSFNAFQHFAALGERGQAIIAQQQPNFMPALGQRTEQAQTIIDQLNNAAQTGQYKAVLDDMRSKGTDPSAVLSNFAPNTMVPETAEAWNVRGKGIQGAVNAGKQIVSQYETKQATIGGLSEEITNPDQVKAFNAGPANAGSRGPIEGTTPRKLPNGEVGSMLPLGSTVPSDLVKFNGEGKWGRATDDKVEAFNKLLDTKQSQGAVEQYKKAVQFRDVIADPKTFQTALGVTLATDKMMGLVRSVVETSNASGNASLNRILETKYGPVDQFLNGMATNLSAVKDALNRAGKGASLNENGEIVVNGKVVPNTPRLSGNTIQGFKDVANFEFSHAQNEARSRLGQALHFAGRNGIVATDTTLDKELQDDPFINKMAAEGRQSKLDDIYQHKYVNEGTAAIMLRPGTTNPAAQSFVKEKLDPPQPAKGPAIQEMHQGAPETTDAQKSRYVNTAIQIESGNNPNARTGSYGGYGGFSDAEAGQRGFDPKNRDQVSQVLAQDYDSNKAAIQKATGTVPTDAQVYLAHQQGLGGVAAHINNPQAPAWQNMASTAEGREKGPAWAKQAIWGNVPDDMKATLTRNGINVNNLTSADFMGLWQAKFNHIADKASGNKTAGDEKPAGGVRGFLQRVGSAYTPVGGGDVNAAQPEFNAEVQRQRAGEMPVAGATIGGAVGNAVGGPALGVVGGAAGGAGGKIIQNYGEGKAWSDGVAREAALGGVQGFAPGSRPIVGALTRAVGTAGVEGTNEALTNPDAGLGDAVFKGAEAGAGQLAGEGAARVFGMALGRAGSHFNEFNAKTQQELMDAGEVVARGKPEAPKANASGQPVSATAKAEHEAAIEAYDDAVDKIKARQLDPEDVAHAATAVKNQTDTGQATVQRPIAQAKRGVGSQLNAIQQDVTARGVGTPKAGPRTDGPLSLPGKTGSGVINTPEMVARMTQAENDAFRPAQNVGERYQNIFEARSNLIADANGWHGGTPPDENTRRSLMAAANNLGDNQTSLLKYVYGDKKGGAMAAKIEELRGDYAKLSNLAKEGDIVGAMAKQDSKGADARALFAKYAKDDPTAQRFATTLVKDRQTNGSGAGSKVLKYTAASIIGMFHVPAGIAAIVAGEMPSIVNGWAVRRAAGGPATLNSILKQRIQAVAQQQRQAGAQGEQFGAAAAGRIGRERLPEAFQ